METDTRCDPFGFHDHDPYERNRKQQLATAWEPMFFRTWGTKPVLISFSAGTAYFESHLFTAFAFRHVYIIEYPHLSETDIEECLDRWKAFQPSAQLTFVPGTLTNIVETLERLDLSTCCAFGLNINLFEPFHLFHDVMEHHAQLEYVLVSYPYMGEYGSSLISTSNVAFFRLVFRESLQDPVVFYTLSGLEDNYLYLTRSSSPS